MYPLTDPRDYEPTPADSIAGIATERGVPANEVLYDTLFGGDGSRAALHPAVQLRARQLRRRLRDDHLAVRDVRPVGRGRALRHDLRRAPTPTTAIAHWTRDRTGGPKVPLEQMVHGQTQRTARHVGWLDRGVLAPGYLADLNVIDLDRIALHPPELVHDLPAGGSPPHAARRRLSRNGEAGRGHVRGRRVDRRAPRHARPRPAERRRLRVTSHSASSSRLGEPRMGVPIQRAARVGERSQ